MNTLSHRIDHRGYHSVGAGSTALDAYRVQR